jgi:hypothetical protein
MFLIGHLFILKILGQHMSGPAEEGRSKTRGMAVLSHTLKAHSQVEMLLVLKSGLKDISKCWPHKLFPEFNVFLSDYYYYYCCCCCCCLRRANPSYRGVQSTVVCGQMQ